MEAFFLGTLAVAILDAFQRGSGWQDAYLEVAREAARRSGRPRPLEPIDSGMEAAVYATTDPRVVLRVTHRETLGNELAFLDEDLSGGVTPVLGWVEVGDFVVTWKERVTPSVRWFLAKRPQGDRIAQLPCGLYHIHRSELRELATYPETRGLAEAIHHGLPVNDLDLDSNLGVTEDGRIVAFDL